jgi:hypothetical protein
MLEPAAFNELLAGSTPTTTLPATYSQTLSFVGDVGAGVNLQVWFAQGTVASPSGGTYDYVPCGCLEGACAAPPELACGYGGPSITTTSVTCNMALSAATPSSGLLPCE